MAPRNSKNMAVSGAGDNSSALATYSGAKGDSDLVDEDIDERILRLLGLEDIFDIDYGTYKTLLRERLAAARMTSSQIPAEEDELLRDEFKRIRSKEGRFKVKKKKITAENIGFQRPSSALVKYKKISSLSQNVSKSEEDVEKGGVDKSIGENLKSINETLDKILKSVISQNNSDRKRRDKERSAGEKRKAQERESGLEKPFQVVKNLASKIIQPFQGILDKVFRFLGFTFLGWLVGKFDQIEQWTKNNKDKINTVTRFLKDWWPALLSAYVLFATPFGKFIRTTLTLVRSFAAQIIRFLAANPLIATGAVAGLATFAAFKWKQDEEKKLINKEAENRNIKPEAVQAELDQAKKSPLGMIGEAFSSIGPFGIASGGTVPVAGFSKGGNINLGKYFSGIVSKDTGNTVSGYGKDTQMFPVEGGGAAVLQPGETVLQVGARERMIREQGVDPLAYNVGPNANKPTKFTYQNGGTVGMKGGGIVGMQGGGETQSQILRSALKGVSLPSQGIRGKGLGGQLIKGYHGTSKSAASSIRQANLYKDWQSRGLGFRSGSPQNYYMTTNSFFSPNLNVAERFATEAATEKRGMFERALNRGVRGSGEIIDVAAPVGSGSFLRLPGLTEQVAKPQTLTKGMRLMDKINQGQYSGSAKAQQLMSKGYTTSSLKGARGVAKTAGRFIPFAGVGLSAADAAMRFSRGDRAGGGLSLISAIPGPIGWGAMGVQGLYDMSRSNPRSAVYKPGGGRQAANMRRSSIRSGASRPNYKPGGGRQAANLKHSTVRRQGGGVVGGTLGFTTKFGGQTNSMFGVTGGLNFGAKNKTGSVSGMLGQGETIKGRTPEQAVSDALYSDLSNTGNWGGIPYALPSSKAELRNGLLGSFSASLTGGSGISGAPKPPKTPKLSEPATTGTVPSQKGEMQFQNAMQAAIYRLQNQGLVDAGGNPYTGVNVNTPNLTTQQIQDLMLAQVALNNRLMSRPNTKLSSGSTQNLIGYNSKVFQAYMSAPSWASYQKGGAARFMKAGRVSTTTGIDASTLGMSGKFGADTQLTPPMALQPGEDLYVVPKQAVPYMDSVVAKLDRNSNPAKVQSNLSKPLGPKITYINLPDKVVKANSSGGGVGSLPSPNLPQFSVTMVSSKRLEVATALGIPDLI